MRRSLVSVRSRVDRLASAVEAMLHTATPAPDLTVLADDELAALERLILKRDAGEKITEEESEQASALVAKCQKVA